MIVTKENVNAVVERFSKTGQYAVDTETFGLHAYKGDRLFSIILADSLGAVYFNFLDYEDGTPVLDDPTVLKPIFENPNSYWFAHNAKFDLTMLRFAGIEIVGTVHCTQAIGLVIRNDKFSYSLANLAKERGFGKDDGVEDEIKKRGLWEWEQIPGKKTRSKDKFFDKVASSTMIPYGLTDGRITRALGLCQIADIETVAATVAVDKPSIKNVYLNELDVTKMLFDLEWGGIPVDKDYVNEAMRYEDGLKDEAEVRFEEITGSPFKDSPKALSIAFDALGIAYPRNEPTALMVTRAIKKGVVPKGNPCFDKGALKNIGHELAAVILKQRAAVKRASTYHRSFLYFSDDNDVLHCNIKQDGATHGRMSCASPNLQNVPKRGDDKSPYPVRKAFVPPPGYFLAMLDFDQQEYRLMLEYAKEFELIEKVKAGLDVHTATAELMGVTRDAAKTLNFMLIYGGGTAKLAGALGLTFDQAFQLKQQYFSVLPGVKKLIKGVMYTAEKRGFIVNWLGRRCHFQDPNFCYTAPNYLIAGGCADVVKVAMVKANARLKGMRSRMALPIHDEVLGIFHFSEWDIVLDLHKIMEQAYPHKLLQLTCGMEVSTRSWHEKTPVQGRPTRESLALALSKELSKKPMTHGEDSVKDAIIKITKLSNITEEKG